MARLGLIGVSTDSKRRSGVYSPSDNISYEDAIGNIQSYTFDELTNALTNTTTPNGLCLSKDGTRLYTTANTGARTTAAIQQYNLTTPFDIRTISFSGISTVVGDHELNPTDLTISDDGTKMFFTGNSNDAIWSLTLSTPYELSTATLDVKSTFVGGQDTAPQNIYITSNPATGISTQYLYVMGNTNDTVYQYRIVNDDISTATLITSKSVTLNTASGIWGETTPRGLYFKSDGTVMYVLGETTDSVIPFDLSSPWQVNTATTRTQSFSVTTQETLPFGLHFKPDGRSLYVIGTTGDDVNQYDLSTPWDLTTASFVGVTTVPSSGVTTASDATPYSIFFKQDDGTKFYVMGGTSDLVRQYSLSVGWAVTSRAGFETSFSVTTQEATPFGLYFNPTGTKMFVIGSTGDDINEYSLSNPWNLSSGVGFTTNTPALVETLPVGLWFGDNGYKVYILGQTNDTVYQYALNTPYDVSAASFAGLTTSLYVGNFDGTPYGVGLSTDGTKLFFVGGTNDRIWRVGLSSAWNVSSCDAFKYVGVEEAIAYSVGFSTDGLNMYMTGGSGFDLNQYTLTSPWDIGTSTLTRTQSYPGTTEANPLALHFKPDGSRLYVVGLTLDTIKQIDLTIPWNISSMTAVGIKTFAYPTLNPGGVFLSDDGTKMYVSDTITDTVKQYTLSTPWDITTATGGLMIYGNFSSPSNLLEATPRGLSISSDGNYLFFTGNGQENIRRITLTSPNTLTSEVSIYSTVQSFSLFTLAPSGMYISPDGKYIYFAQIGLSRRVRQIKLGTPFDLSTASLSSNYINLFGNPNAMNSLFGIHLSNNLDRMFVINDIDPELGQYSVQFL